MAYTFIRTPYQMAGFGADAVLPQLTIGEPIALPTTPVQLMTTDQYEQKWNEVRGIATKIYAWSGASVLVDIVSAEAAKFMTWLSLYDRQLFDDVTANVDPVSKTPKFSKENIDNIKVATKKALDVPEWFYTKLLIPTAVWELWKEACARCQAILQTQTLTKITDVISYEAFVAWWKLHDLAGEAAFTARMMADKGEAAGWVPQSLYNFFVQDQGKNPPPANLIGKDVTWWDWACNNWWYVAGGLAGGWLFARVLIGKRKTKKQEAFIKKNAIRRW
jgi:hypothetical protein